MDPSQIGNVVLGLALAVSALGQWASGQARKTRKRSRVYEARIIKAQQIIDTSLAGRLKHNAEQHPTGEGAIDIYERPDLLMMEDDDA